MDWEGRLISVQNLTFRLPDDPFDNLVGDWVVDPLVMREDYTDPTLMASRWFVEVTEAQPPTGFGLPTATVGVGLIAWDATLSEGLEGPDALDLPRPVGDTDYDWIQRFVCHFGPDNDKDNRVRRNDWDLVHLSKAKRRLGNSRSILMVAEAVSFDAGSSISGLYSVEVDVRCLIKE
jgi:hypothetical protein